MAVRVLQSNDHEEAEGPLGPDELRSELQRRRNALKRLGAQVDGTALLDEFISLVSRTDLPAPRAEPLLTLTAAATASGVSADHLGRLVRKGDVPNHGRRRAPRVRLSECPVKKPDLVVPADRTRFSGTQRARVMQAARPKVV